jgi:hypothetical protein
MTDLKLGQWIAMPSQIWSFKVCGRAPPVRHDNVLAAGGLLPRNSDRTAGGGVQSLPKGSEQPAPLLVLSALGLALAMFWGWVAWNRVEIINRWRAHVVGLDQLVDPHRLYEGEGRLANYSLRRPTSATMFLPFLLAFGWIVLLILSIVWLVTPNC